MAGRCFYVSWVDLRTDPWPQWEKIRPGAGDTVLDGQVVRYRPDDDPHWPGIPVVEQSEPVVVVDPRMGRYVWPGIPWQIDGRLCRLYVGPTISALLHPGSRFYNLESLDAVYILHQPERANGPQEMLREVLVKVCEARGVKNADKRIKLAPVKGIADPTDHAAIIHGIEKWLEHQDPFRIGEGSKQPTRIVVNLSPGTPAMHSAWLMLRWKGALGGVDSVVEFVQGDGGLADRAANEGQPPANPLRIVPIDVLSQFIGRASRAPQPAPSAEESGVPLEELIGPPFDDLRQRIDHAARLGLPILLQGERGTGKTFLASYYHRRRQVYRGFQAEAAAATKGATKGKSKEAPPKAGVRFPKKIGDSNFVGVTLSEYAEIDTLRDTLFGWIIGAFTDAKNNFDGLLGEAHDGTLFLDEIHHLARPLQSALLGPLNNGRYRPKMSTCEVISHFDLVVATNDPQWRDKLAEDFRDRIERIVLEVPAFRSFQRHGTEIIWHFWEFTLRRRCRECGIDYPAEGTGWPECREMLLDLFRRRRLSGNWRDLQRLADNLLLHLTSPTRDGRPSPIRWEREKLKQAIDETFTDA